MFEICRTICRPARAARAALARFARDRRANVAITFGLAAIPLILAVGAAVDLARGFMVKQRLSHALDAAALAVGSSLEKSNDELTALAQSYFDANYPATKLGVPGELQLSVEDNVIMLSASAKVDATLMRIAGYDWLDVAANTEVMRRITGLELVMVLDNTGSMNSGGKIGTLKTAAHDLVNILFGEQTEPDFLKIGLVPFAAAVNVGTQYRDSGWIDVEGRSSVAGINLNYGTSTKLSPLQAYDMITNKSWNGCVEARPMPMDIDDTPPAYATPDTLWVPYFAPDEPDWWPAISQGYWYSNSYLPDSATGSLNMQVRQATPGKYSSAVVYSDGPHYNCETRPLTPLTNDKTVIANAIDAMQATGTTNIPIGMAWGWRVISPGEPFTEGAAYTDKKWKKAVILLTDGENVLGVANNHNGSRYGAYGYVKDARLGTTNKWTAQDRLDERTAEVCANIKAANPDEPIVVYTITFQLSNGPTKDLMRNCASDPEKYFDSPSNEELRETFKVIAGELSELRLSR